MPNADTTDIRNKARRVKNHILTKYLKLSDRVEEKGEGDLSDKEYKTYYDMTSEFARNVVPRTQEVTGEDGGALEVTLVKYALPNGDTTPLQVPAETLPVTDTASV